MKKRLFILSAVLILCISSVACGGSDEEGAQDEYNVQSIESDGLTIEAYNQKIVEDEDGNKCVAIWFHVTNNNDTEDGFEFRQSMAKQNGKELSFSSAINPETNENYNIGFDQTVAQGETHELVLCYTLIDEETPVEIEFYGYSAVVEHVTMSIELE